jgi:transcriptional regulator with XRE-family HTH domain
MPVFRRQQVFSIDNTERGWHGQDMKLAEYMRRNNLSLRAMADQVGTNYSQIRQWQLGRRAPSLEWAERIKTATGGKVKPKDFLEDRT